MGIEIKREFQERILTIGGPLGCHEKSISQKSRSNVEGGFALTVFCSGVLSVQFVGWAKGEIGRA